MEKVPLVESAQTTGTLFMVRPAAFGYNQETAPNNAFQHDPGDLSADEINWRAQREFDAFVAKLRSAGIEVIVGEDQSDPARPDAVFPNNWVSFHADGTIITYPMFSALRRQERREDLLEEIARRYGFDKRVHLEKSEAEGAFLEGTGSMILDRPNRLVYACLSPRTDASMLEAFCRQRDYEKVAFRAVDEEGKEIYHTNVMMALGRSMVLICMESIPDEDQRNSLRDRFAGTRKQVIEISFKQMHNFAGNALEVHNQKGKPFLVMSEKAYRALTRDQIRQIERHATPLFSPLTTIETYGGGSARCMMAEVFPPA